MGAVAISTLAGALLAKFAAARSAVSVCPGADHYVLGDCNVVDSHAAGVWHLATCCSKSTDFVRPAYLGPGFSSGHVLGLYVSTCGGARRSLSFVDCDDRCRRSRSRVAGRIVSLRQRGNG